jgi:hypothetical protein
MSPLLIDRAGQLYGKWTALEYIGNEYWKCRCECGHESNISTSSLRMGGSKGCINCRKLNPRFRSKMCSHEIPVGQKGCMSCQNARVAAKKRIVKETDHAAWRARELRRKGITPEAHSKLLEQQNGRCANPFCTTVANGVRGRNANLCIDHNHNCCPKAKSCGKCLRGLLCGHCNLILGHAKDSRQVLQGLIDYLRRYEQ